MCYSLTNLYGYFPHSCHAQEKAMLQGYNPSKVKRGDVPMVTLQREAERFGAQYLILWGLLRKNASYFIVLAHDVRGRWCWYGSRVWTFPPIFHYTLLLWDRRQQRGSLTVWWLRWQRVWRSTVSPNSSTWKKRNPLTFTNACWKFVETQQWMWAQQGSEWCASAVAIATVAPPLMRIFTSAACRLLFVTGKNAQLMVVELCWKSLFCSWEFALSVSVTMLFLPAVVSLKINWRHCLWSNIYCAPASLSHASLCHP